ncbi:T6 antigen [Dorea longicatena]|uniref:T6 antigen n=1 Tax=Dorea longicatena TaxID=88431 RepID=A0A173RI85_9FIRM|nr:VaFE repeat-containing surface-anchored protein [Dorea longicatena]CUM77495.1 T6 antigen [Dorea longicatena]
MKAEAKKRLTQFVNSLFAVVLVVGLLPTWALSNPQQAYAAPADYTVTATVDGLDDDTLPVLVGGTDFTPGQPVNADPVYYTDANGNTPLADLAAQKAKQGLSLKWIDAETGKDFSWTETPINKSYEVEGTWVQTQCTVTVNANDGGKTAKQEVTVPWGKSYASVKGGAPATPTYTGWQFLGWYTKDGKQYDFNSTVTESVVVEAKWAVADVTVVPTTNPDADVDQTLSGTCWIGATWSWHPAQFALSNFSGKLAGVSATGYCADRSAAPASNVQATYSATLKSVNVETGEVVYDLYITPPDATNGKDRNQYGLIGYQHISAQVTLIKNFGGWIEVNKSSSNPAISDNNDCYDLEGAEYAVFNQSNQAVAKLTTDKNGYAKSGLLPSGEYTVKELKAPKGYALDEEGHQVRVTSGQTTTSNLVDKPQSDPVGTLLGKYDGEKTYNGEKNLPLGSASLYGAQYSVEYYDGYYDSVADAEASGNPTRKWVLQTDEDGYVNLRYADQSFEVHDANGNVTATLPYKVSGDDFYRAANGAISLPLGTAVIKEIKAPKGYNLPKPFGMDQSFVRQITVDGNIDVVHSYNAPEQAEPVFRSDLEFTKAASDDSHSLAGVPFKITSKTTGESHVIVTDENGKASTKASWNKHTQDTNGNDWIMSEDTEGIQGFVAKLLDAAKVLDPTCGVWFGQYTDGDETKITDPDDERGALPYDEYTLEELPCDANAGYQLIKKDFTVSRDNTFNADNTVNLGTLTDQDVSISTQAYDKADGDQEVVAEPDVTVVDKVSCDNIQKGTEYIINGTLMDKATGKPYVDAAGNEVHGSVTFTAKSQEQDAFVEFTFDGSNLTDSTELVVFETIATTESPDRILDNHEDINDLGQTVTVKPPVIGTIATDGIDNDKQVVKDTEMVVTDTVAYYGLTPGKQYTLKGELMDKATGAVLKDAAGNPVTAEKQFIPNATAGTVEIQFTFNGSNLKKDQSLVAFEHVLTKGKEIATHAEITDIPQTVTVIEPSIKTTAKSSQAGHEGDKNVVRDTTATVKDTVEYKNLVPGKEYTLIGKMMDKATGNALLKADGSEVTGKATFTPESSNGTATVEITFDCADLDGHSLVAFEKLYRGETTIASHEDIDDVDQTVKVDTPLVETTATSSQAGHDGDKNIVRDTEATLTDTVEYKGLVTGKEYTFIGTVIDKVTGKALLNADGSEVTASKTIKAADTYGTVELEFTLNCASLDGHELVVFEKIYQDGKEIGSHEDLNDGDQTVTVISPELATTAIDGIDGDKNVVKDPEAEVTDTVEYKGLVTGKEYKITGTIMDKATGNPYIDPSTGKEITGETTFTPDDTYGTVDVKFAFDASQLDENSQLVVFEKISRNGEEIGGHEDIDDEAQAVSIVVPEIHTNAADGLDGDKEVIADHKASVVDTVSYDNLVPGKEYKVSGTLMVKETGEALLDVDGNPVTASATFTPEKPKGSVDVVFEFDADLLAGKKLVAFEKLYRNQIEITVHEDIDDEDQTTTVVPPQIGTTATDTADGDKHMAADPESSITDEIQYKNLVPGDEYQVAGILMDKATGLPLLSGEGASAISAEDLQKFADDLKAACELDSGDVSAIEIDGKAFGDGHEVKLVAGKYEWSDDNGSGQYLEKTDDGWKLVEFSDSADMSNSKEIGTYTDDQVKLTKDTPVLPLNPDYEAIAKVMQENPDIVSCLSIQKKTFTPEEQSGTVSMDFPINSIYNEDTETVVFEFLFKGSELIANESDIQNEGQTVEIVTPKLSTTATDKTDGDHTLLPSREATVVDHVEYTDLIPGKEYTIEGVLMDKATGTELIVGDGKVTAVATFVPNKANGSVDLEFTFDASELGGKDLVAFEIAYKDGIQIADHQDIDDEAQTVTVSEPDDNTFDTPGGDGYSKTGVDMTLIYALIAALIALAGGAGAYAYRHRKLAAAEGKTDGESDEE